MSEAKIARLEEQIISIKAQIIELNKRDMNIQESHTKIFEALTDLKSKIQEHCYVHKNNENIYLKLSGMMDEIKELILQNREKVLNEIDEKTITDESANVVSLNRVFKVLAGTLVALGTIISFLTTKGVLVLDLSKL